MTRSRFPVLWLVCVCALAMGGCAVSGARQSAVSRNSALHELARLLTGTYNNHAQVWQARRRNGADVPAYTRVRISRVRAGLPGAVALRYSEYRPAHDANTLRRRVRWVLRPGDERGEIVQSVYTRRAAGWRELSGCRVYWHRREAGFRGATRGADCRFRKRSSGETVTFARAYTVTPAGLVYTLKRTSGNRTRVATLKLAPTVYYQGWAGVRRADGGTGEQPDWQLDETIRLHNQGGSARLKNGFGQPLGYGIRLEQLVWPNSHIAMLRLSIINTRTHETVAYAWAAPRAERIGISLERIQVGLRRIGGPAAGTSTGQPVSPQLRSIGE